MRVRSVIAARRDPASLPDPASAGWPSGFPSSPKGQRSTQMAKRDTTATWREIDPATLQPQVAKAYTAYKAHYKAGQELKKAFEAEMAKAAELPTTHRLAIAYNFGKLSIAVVEATEERTASKKATSLADALKAA
jgi:hypothetical protein